MSASLRSWKTRVSLQIYTRIVESLRIISPTSLPPNAFIHGQAPGSSGFSLKACGNDGSRVADLLYPASCGSCSCERFFLLNRQKIERPGQNSLVVEQRQRQRVVFVCLEAAAGIRSRRFDDDGQ